MAASTILVPAKETITPTKLGTPAPINAASLVPFFTPTVIQQTWLEKDKGANATKQRTDMEYIANQINAIVVADPPVSGAEKSALNMMKKNYDSFVKNAPKNLAGSNGEKLMWVIRGDFATYRDAYKAAYAERKAIQKEFDQTRSDIEKLRAENATLEKDIIAITEQKRQAIQKLPQVLLDKKTVLAKLYQQKLVDAKIAFAKNMLVEKQEFDQKFIAAAKQKNLQITAAINQKLIGGA